MHPSVAQAVMEEEGGTAFGQQTLKRAILQASVSLGESGDSQELVFDSLCFCGDHPLITMAIIWQTSITIGLQWWMFILFLNPWKSVGSYGNPHQFYPSLSGFRPLAKWPKPFAARLNGPWPVKPVIGWQDWSKAWDAGMIYSQYPRGNFHSRTGEPVHS